MICQKQNGSAPVPPTM